MSRVFDVVNHWLSILNAGPAERARAIGSYELSILPFDDCCNLFVPKHPATNARPEHARDAEDGLPIDEMVTELVDGVERIDIEP